jgi:hypothetical protein
MTISAIVPRVRALAFALVAASIATSVAHAQTKGKVTRIDVIEYGLYTADIAKKEKTTTGVSHNIVDNIRHAVTTRTVPAQRGVHFGFRYKIVGAPANAPVTLTKVTIFPPDGLHKPGLAKPILRNQYDLVRKTGQTSFTDYSFDETWELVPGTWTFELWVGKRKLATETFNVVKQ